MHMKVYVIDNGGQWTHREWRILRYRGIEAEIVPNTLPFDEIADADALVLSGGAPRVGMISELGNCVEYLGRATFPILGICAGHQYMAHFFGGECAQSTIPEFGKVEIEVVEEDDLFKGLPKKMVVWVSHNDEVTVVPKEFEILASSVNCRVQAMRHKRKPFYGLQFHPEVEHTEYGEEIFQNFLNEGR